MRGGGAGHYEYRVVGKTVITASRIESLNKHLDTWLLVSEDVLGQINGFSQRKLGQFILLGKSEPTAVYELIAREEESSDQQKMLCRYFSEGLDAYLGERFEEAKNLFNTCLKINKEDKPSSIYIDLCNQYIQDPPSGDWDGTIRMHLK